MGGKDTIGSVLNPHGDGINRQQIIRYAGNKAKILDFLIPIITKNLPAEKTILDLFAGTHSVGYALKDRNQVIGNDVQRYSWAIGKGIIEADYSLSKTSAEKEILPLLKSYDVEGYHLFSETFAGTYFGLTQCNDIDKLKFAIDTAEIPVNKRFAYLCCLMYAMSKVASTTGYFAQYLAPRKTRELKRLSVVDAFLNRCEKFSIVKSKTKNYSLNFEYTKLFSTKRLKKYVEQSSLVYADPPYSAAQYSRYYHILETLVKYDYPTVEFKGLYRKDRCFSGFSNVSKVNGEFQNLFSNVAKFDKPLILSYVNSGSGLLPEKEVVELAESNFSTVSKPIKLDYNHSMMGNGKPKKVEEFLLVCKN